MVNLNTHLNTPSHQNANVIDVQDVTARFNEIYDLTYKSVLSFVTAKCGNTADIHDIVQDTYVEIYRILQKRGIDYINDERSIALRIARQKLSKYYTVMQRLKSRVVSREDEPEVLDSLADSFLTEDFVINQILLEKVKSLIAAKPQDVKKVFYLYYDAGNTIAEIAELLNMSESNVKHKLYRTIKELREVLS